MENNQLNEKKKMSNKVKRLIIGLSLVCVSLTIGAVSGIQIAKLVDKTPSTSTPSTGTETYESLDKIVTLLKENWYSDIYYPNEEFDEDLLIHQFVGALSSSEEKRLDPYTYFTKNESSVSYGQPLGKLGITLTNFYNIPVVTEVYDKGTAYGHILPGDIVVTLGKQSLTGNTYTYYSITEEGMDFSNLFNYGLGQPGQTQYMKVARFDENGKLTYVEKYITLGDKSRTEYAYLEYEDIEDTIMVKLTGFTTDNENHNGSKDQLEEILKNDDSSNLILDLRDNGGGDLSSAVDICDLFLSKDKLVTSLEFKNGGISEYYTDDKDAFEYDNIVILQNENTASASEVLIGALKYHLQDKVAIVGTKSYGKGIAQTKVQVLEGAYTLQYTCAKWFMPDGSWLGMTIDSSSDVGFKPNSENTVTSNELYDLMEFYNYYYRSYGYTFYKENLDYYNAFTLDEVAYQNQFFFEILNKSYGYQARTDMYFDNTCVEAIKNYQALKGLESSGNMNLDTFICFTYDYYMQSYNYNYSFVNKAKNIIGG